MSLRTRLLLGLLAVAAAGLAVFAIASYRSLDSYLGDRTDDQVRAAIEPAVSILLQNPANARCAGEANGPGGSPPTGGPAGLPPGVGTGQFGPAPGPGDSDAKLPPGTYVELRDADGQRCASHFFGSYPEAGFDHPDLPQALSTTAPNETLDLTTVGSTGGGSTDFRVAALSPQEGGSSIVIAVPTTETTDTLNRLALTELIVAIVVLIALGILAFYVVRLGLRPLERMEATAGEIAAGDLTRRVEPADPRTEVGRLGIALNSMLEQIESAFAAREASETKMRQFLADASHELRTPLASIRGYSELYRLGAAEDPEDLEKAMSRIEAESARMGSLVDDLMTLARLDEVRKGVREPVDLSELASEAVEDARAAAPAREISLEAESVTIEADRDQLRQVLGNLLRNADTHTPAGTPVEVTVASVASDPAEEGGARITVRDHGPGLGDAAGPELFERFWRAGAARDRESGGAGLGLAIVAAIVEAHGGAVTAGDAPSGGAIFTVTLPRDQTL